MRGRSWPLLFALLASCAPQQAYEPPTTTAAIIRPRRAPPPPVQPRPQPSPPTQIQRPPQERSTITAAATALAAELASPVLVLMPPTPETETLSRVLPPIVTSGELPGTLEVIATLRSVGGVAMPTPGLGGPMPRGFGLWWLFPFFPFGLSRAGGL
ncbi:MAG TPA: hypothetical protein VLM85_21175 [Polyangiaceae bacterium]|nr:hypothetical protein [Polyangiaceae bacterium]